MEDVDVDGTRGAFDCGKRAHSIHVGIQRSPGERIAGQAVPESGRGFVAASSGWVVFFGGGDMEEEQGVQTMVEDGKKRAPNDDAGHTGLFDLQKRCGPCSIRGSMRAWLRKGDEREGQRLENG
jgi:hypothetical protein